MTEDQIGIRVMAAAFRVHRELGPGLLENIYEGVLERELIAAGLEVERQVPVPIRYRDHSFEEGFHADLIIENKVIVELKSIEQLQPVHYKQMLSYLRLMDCRLGLLINFGENLMRDGFKSVINGSYEWS